MANKKSWCPVDKFVKTYVKVHRSDGTAKDVAKLLGLETQTVNRRASSLRKGGVELPELCKSERKTMLEVAKESLREALEDGDL